MIQLHQDVVFYNSDHKKNEPNLSLQVIYQQHQQQLIDYLKNISYDDILNSYKH